MAAYVLDRRRVDAVSTGEAVEMPAQARPLRHPPTDPEVRVIALRKHPAVAAGHDAELHPGRSGVRVASERAPRDVALERYATDDALAEPGRPRDDTVRPVRADEEARIDEVRPRRVQDTPASPTSTSLTATPSRNSAPAAAARSAR